MAPSPFFSGKEFAIELGKNTPYSHKSELSKNIKEHGGKIGYTISKTTNFVITNSSSSLSNYKLSIILRSNVQVVDEEFVSACIKSGSLVDSTPFITQNGIIIYCLFSSLIQALINI